MFKLTQIITSSPLTLYIIFIFAYLITFDVKYLLFLVLFYIFGIWFNIILKNIFKQQRPVDHGGCGLYDDVYKEKSYGMPSQHVQIWSVLATFWTIYLIKNCQHKYIIVSIFIFWVLTGIVAIQRVSSKCHTFGQVFVGFIAGVISGFIMYQICHCIKPQIFI